MAQLERLKLTASVWDSDKDPQGFSSWADTFSSLVRATDHGGALEDFISYKTGRQTFQVSNVPSFLSSDPDFDMPIPGTGGLDFDSVSNVPPSAAHPRDVQDPEDAADAESPLKRRE